MTRHVGIVQRHSVSATKLQIVCVTFKN